MPKVREAQRRQNDPLTIPEIDDSTDEFSMSADALSRHMAEGREFAVMALLTTAENGCQRAGNPLDDDSPERQVLSGTIFDYATVLGIREVDCIPRVAFNCPDCHGRAEVINVITYRCFKCGDSTRMRLALHVLSRADLLTSFLERAARTKRSGAAA